MPTLPFSFSLSFSRLLASLWLACCLVGTSAVTWAAPTSAPTSRPAKASALPAPKTLKTPRIALKLMADHEVVQPGQQLWVGIHQTIKTHWHTYWRNPGDSGTAPKMVWQLPKGVTAGPLQWPLPHKLKVAHLVNYGYSDTVMLLVKIQIPADYKHPTLQLQGRFNWLVCLEECIPGKGVLSLHLRVGKKAIPSQRWAAHFAKTIAHLPLPPGAIKLKAKVGKERLRLQFTALPKELPADATLVFFPASPSVLHNAAKIKAQRSGQNLSLDIKKNDYFSEDTATLSGVLVASWGKGKAHKRRGYTLTTQLKPPTKAVPGVTKTKTGASSTATAPTRRPPPPVAQTTGAKTGGLRGFLAQVKQASLKPVEEESLGLWQALLFALFGGLLLNLMPCVFPVLSIKVMHFVEQAEETSSSVRKHGFAFVAGVMLSFTTLAGVLLALRASGQMLGWGFQLQSPLFVWALLVLLFGMGLSLSGLFELGGSLMSVGEGLTHKTGYAGSFFTGVLATIVATPCTAPLMAPALGWALTQPALTSLLVFNALGFGMALPYALFSVYPRWLRILPKPGAWMEKLKQVMAFALYGTAIWLLWVLGKQSGVEGVVTAMMGLLAVAFAGWLFGSTRYSKRQKLATFTAACVLLVGVGWSSKELHQDANKHIAHVLAQTQLSRAAAGIAGPGQQQAYAPVKLDRLLDQRQHVLLNMTAAWCISCKVNEKVALKSSSVVTALRKHKVYYLVGDWTNQDAEITKVLAIFKRSGVPLYVLFDSKRRRLQVLPQILTPGILTQAIAKLSR